MPRAALTVSLTWILPMTFLTSTRQKGTTRWGCAPLAPQTLLYWWAEERGTGWIRCCLLWAAAGLIWTCYMLKTSPGGLVSGSRCSGSLSASWKALWTNAHTSPIFQVQICFVLLTWFGWGSCVWSSLCLAYFVSSPSRPQSDHYSPGKGRRLYSTHWSSQLTGNLAWLWGSLSQRRPHQCLSLQTKTISVSHDVLSYAEHKRSSKD